MTVRHAARRGAFFSKRARAASAASLGQRAAPGRPRAFAPPRKVRGSAPSTGGPRCFTRIAVDVAHARARRAVDEASAGARALGARSRRRRGAGRRPAAAGGSPPAAQQLSASASAGRRSPCPSRTVRRRVVARLARLGRGAPVDRQPQRARTAAAGAVAHAAARRADPVGPRRAPSDPTRRSRQRSLLAVRHVGELVGGGRLGAENFEQVLAEARLRRRPRSTSRASAALRRRSPRRWRSGPSGRACCGGASGTARSPPPSRRTRIQTPPRARVGRATRGMTHRTCRAS